MSGMDTGMDTVLEKIENPKSKIANLNLLSRQPEHRNQNSRDRGPGEEGGDLGGEGDARGGGVGFGSEHPSRQVQREGRSKEELPHFGVGGRGGGPARRRDRKPEEGRDRGKGQAEKRETGIVEGKTAHNLLLASEKHRLDLVQAQRSARPVSRGATVHVVHHESCLA